MELASDLAVLSVGRNERGDGDGSGVGKELGDLTDATDVLIAVGLGEAKVLVQAEAHVVAIKTIGGEPQMQEMLLKGGGDGGLA